MRSSLAGFAGVGVGIRLNNKYGGSAVTQQVPKHRLGKTSEMVSMFGLGGWHMGNIKEEKEAINVIHTAFDLGVNFFDSAYSYNEGESEIRYGKALKAIRDKVFLMSKSTARTKKDFENELHESMRRMQTDYIDLYQLHSMKTKEDVETIFGPDGAMETAEKAKKEGKIRHIGMTSHLDPNLLVYGLQFWDGHAAMQMPVNPLDPHYLSNIKIIVPKLVEKNIAVLAMKTISAGNIVKQKVATAHECLRFVWSQPVTVLISGCDSMQMMKENVQAAIDFTPMTPQEQEDLLARTAPYKGTEVESYKKKV